MEAKDGFELSPFNINYDFKDREHIELLKKQIQQGAKLEIVCYEDNGKLKVIDGGHSLVAYEELELDPKEQGIIRVEKFDSIADMIAFSRKRNSVRLQQEPTRYTRSMFQELKIRLKAETDEVAKKILRRWYNVYISNSRAKETEQDACYNNVIVTIFQGERITPESFVSNNLSYLEFPDWLAEMVDKQLLSASQASIINNGKLRGNEPLQKRIADICIGKEVRWTQELIKDVTDFKPQETAFWNFPKSMDVFGDPNFPGRCNGELVMNVLYYWTKEGDLIVDPMAGSGTTLDVCKLMNRKCLAYDIQPYHKNGELFRKEIRENDIKNGYPKEIKDCDLIFLDPPYYKKKEKEYGLGELTKNSFLAFMTKLAKDTFETLKANGICVLLISDYFASQQPEIILSAEYWKIFREAGFQDVMRVVAPLPLASLKATYPEQEENIHKLLDVNRDLYIFRRPTKEANE